MKLKITLLIGTHETKHGVDSYVRVVKKNETVREAIEALQAECDYDEENPGCNEYFDSDVEEVIIDTDDFEVVE